jgi:SAM-dependent methyltransferase
MTDASPWARNLGWLGRNWPDLRRRITASASPPRLEESAEGLRWTRGLTPIPVGLSPEQAAARLNEAALPSGARVVVAGCGTGALVVEALARGHAVVAWDRDPSFLRPMLRRHALVDALAAGRLVLAAGADLLEQPAEAVVAHPVLGRAYADDLDLHRQRPARRALLVEGTLLVDDVARALRQHGLGVFRWDVHDLVEAELDAIARRVDPEVVVAVNHTPGLAEACEALGVPLVTWEIDPATDRVRPTTAGGAAVLTWKRSQVEVYRAAGFRSRHLMLATDPERRRPVPLTPGERAELDVPLAYVGSSMVGRGRELLEAFLDGFARIHGASQREAGRELAATLLGLQRQAGRRYVIPELLHRVAPDLGARFEAAGIPHRPEALLGEVAAATYRLDTLAALAPLGLHVWGDPGWRALEAAGATYRGWAGHDRALTRIYSGPALHVDVGRLYQLDIVPMRIFDVLACGGFVLAEHSEDLERCFVLDEEVVAWRSREELLSKARYYLAHPEEARAIAARGRARVLRDHTIRGRVGELLEAARSPAPA